MTPLHFKEHNIDEKKMIVSDNLSVMETIKAIQDGGLRIVFVVDSGKKLLGVVTDGDVRRSILRGIPLDSSVKEIMNKTPLVALNGTSKAELDLLLESYAMDHIPLVTRDRILIGVHVRSGYMSQVRPNIVVLMAGGKGTRLRPLTDSCPKPLLAVGGTPILEIIIKNLKQFGFRKFFISINYEGARLQEYFGDGKSLGVEINYIKEDKYLGTAGALSLLPITTKEPLLVMNGDILTSLNFAELLDSHSSGGNDITLCSYIYDMQVPYGVLEVDGVNLVSCVEKPMYTFFVNGGIYVISIDVLEFVPKNSYFDMTDLLSTTLDNCKKVCVFPIHEYWIDVGSQSDLLKAHLDRLRRYEV